MRDGELLFVAAVVLNKIVPIGGDLVEELFAADLVPVRLCVGERRHSKVPGDALVREASLGDPNGLASSNTDNGVVGGLEQVGGIFDGVVIAGLVVRIFIHTQPVDRVNDGTVGAVCEGVPGVDVTDRHISQGSVGEFGLVIVDEAHDGVGISTHASLVGNASSGVA